MGGGCQSTQFPVPNVPAMAFVKGHCLSSLSCKVLRAFLWVKVLALCVCVLLMCCWSCVGSTAMFCTVKTLLYYNDDEYWEFIVCSLYDGAAVYSIRCIVLFFVCLLFYLRRSFNHCCKMFFYLTAAGWLCGAAVSHENSPRCICFRGFIDSSVLYSFISLFVYHKNLLTRLNCNCIRLCRSLLVCLLTWTTTFFC